MILCYFVCFYRALSPNIYCLTGRIAGWIPQPGGNPRYEAQAERSLEVARFEELTDERLESADGDARPPPSTEKEVGCIRRACKILSTRIPFLCGLFGRQMPVLEGADICGFWRAVRKLGSTEEIWTRTGLCECTQRPGWQKSAGGGAWTHSRRRREAFRVPEFGAACRERRSCRGHERGARGGSTHAASRC